MQKATRNKRALNDCRNEWRESTVQISTHSKNKDRYQLLLLLFKLCKVSLVCIDFCTVDVHVSLHILGLV